MLARVISVATAAAAATALACGSDPMMIIDAGHPDASSAPDAFAVIEPLAPAGPAEPAAPALPAPPAPADFLPCPDGWPAETSTRAHAETICRPDPGTPCPIGQWPDVLPIAARLLYVDPAANPGGDGSSNTPYATLAAALAAARDGDALVLARGTFAEAPTLARDLIVAGTCPRDTIITGKLTITGEVELTALTIRGASRYGLDITATASALLTDVIIDDTQPDPLSRELGWGIKLKGRLEASRVIISRSREQGIWIDGPSANAILDRVLITDTESSPANGLYGRALEVTSGAQLTANRLLIERAREVAIYASDATTNAAFTDLVVRDTERRDAGGDFGRALLANDGATITLDRAVIDGAYDTGALVLDTATKIAARDLIIRDILPAESRGIGLTAEGGAILELERAWIERASAAGMTITLASTATLDDLTIIHTRGTPSGGLGAGLVITGGSQVDLQRAHIEDNHLAGVLAAGRGTIARLEDLTVKHIESLNLTGRFGRGLGLEEGAELFLTRAAIDDTREAGLFVSGAIAHVEDLKIEHVSPNAAGDVFARGILAQQSAHLDGARVLLAENQSVALAASGTSSIALADLIIRDTESDPNGQFGIAIAALEANGVAPTIEVSRALLERNRHIAIYADGPSALVRAGDLTVRDTRPQIARDAFGSAAMASGGGSIELERALLERNHFAAVGATGEGTAVSLIDVLIRATEVDGNGIYGNGLGVEKDAVARLLRVRIEDNRQFGALAQSGGEIELREVSILDTKRLACSDPACEEIAAGVGLGAWDGKITAERFVLAGNEIAGAAMAAGGTIDLRTGEITGHPIGVNIQTEGFDRARIEDGVVFRDNAINVDAATLPVPNPFQELPAVTR